jgi:hypothetical protein
MWRRRVPTEGVKDEKLKETMKKRLIESELERVKSEVSKNLNY